MTSLALARGVVELKCFFRERDAVVFTFALPVVMLRLVARGLSNAEIGAEFHIAETTVKTHLLRAFAKLGVSDRTAAVTTAMAEGIL